jgi:hypothetical protein
MRVNRGHQNAQALPRLGQVIRKAAGDESNAIYGLAPRLGEFTSKGTFVVWRPRRGHSCHVAMPLGGSIER